MSAGLGEVEILRSHLIRSGGLASDQVDLLVEAFEASATDSFVEFLARNGVIRRDVAGPLAAATRGEGPIHGLITPVSPSIVAKISELVPKKPALPPPALPPFPGFGDSTASLEDRLSSIVKAVDPRPSQPVDPNSWLKPGARFARYKLESHLGEGSTSTTFRAKHPTLGIPVAIKIFRSTERTGAHGDSHDKFEAEGRLLARLDHPNIVRVFDVDTHAGLPFIVFEFAGTHSLEQRIETRGPLPSARVVEIGVAIATALDAAWQSRILHRDVKPDNILIRADERVKLVDFGLAIGDEEKNPELVVGSPAYMAPEQITEPHLIDHRADMYALGATLYHTVVGHPPFVRETPKQTLRAQLYEFPTPIRALVPDASAALEEVTLRLLQKRREDRFETWPEAIQAIASTLANTQEDAEEVRSSLGTLFSSLIGRAGV